MGNLEGLKKVYAPLFVIIFPFLERSKKLGEKGHIGVQMASFLLGLTLAMGFLLNGLKSHRLIEKRFNTYLCYHHIQSKRIQYLKRMSLMNNVIIALNIGILFTGPIALYGVKGVKRLQLGLHYLSLFKMNTSPHCNLKQVLFNTEHPGPYSHGMFFGLKRTPLAGTAIRKRIRKWNIRIINFSTQDPFVIRGLYSFSKLRKKKRRQAQEFHIPLKALRSLSGRSGAKSWPYLSSLASKVIGPLKKQIKNLFDTFKNPGRK